MTRFDRLADLLRSWTGLDLARGGTIGALERFVRNRARILGFRSPDAYIDALGGPRDPEAARLIDAVTVGHTWFFRDPGQLTAVGDVLASFPPGRRVHVWAPACSTGEEAWTVAMIADRLARPISVLGTDINERAIEQARIGRYGAFSVRDLPPEHARHVLRKGEALFDVDDALRASVAFAQHNLMDPPPTPPCASGWDVVLCRNVLFYFDAMHASATVRRLAGALAPDGWLFLGASDPLRSPPPTLVSLRIKGRPALRRTSHAIRLAPPRAENATAPELRAVPDTPRGASLALAHRRVADGDLLAAIAEYAAVLDGDPLSIEARLFLGIAQYLSRDLPAALLTLRSALFLDPRLWPAAYYLALASESLGDRQVAQREYRRVVETIDRPLHLSGADAVVGDLTAWRREVLAIARGRMRGRLTG
jgi:chemotaxis protein methyltransferase CheR